MLGCAVWRAVRFLGIVIYKLACCFKRGCLYFYTQYFLNESKWRDQKMNECSTAYGERKNLIFMNFLSVILYKIAPTSYSMFICPSMSFNIYSIIRFVLKLSVYFHIFIILYASCQHLFQVIVLKVFYLLFYQQEERTRDIITVIYTIKWSVCKSE